MELIDKMSGKFHSKSKYYAAAFKRSPGKYKSLQGYMIAQEYAKLGE